MIRAATVLAAMLALANLAARAQNYPSRAITLIIPFAAGGSNDVVGRAIGKKLTEAWGQPVVIDNRAGACALIGTAASPAHQAAYRHSRYSGALAMAMATRSPGARPAFVRKPCARRATRAASSP